MAADTGTAPELAAAPDGALHFELALDADGRLHYIDDDTDWIVPEPDPEDTLPWAVHVEEVLDPDLDPAQLPALRRRLAELASHRPETVLPLPKFITFDVGNEQSNGDIELLLERMNDYMFLDDPDAVLFALAVHVSAARTDGEPLWGQIIDPPSGGKGEIIRVLEGTTHKTFNDVTLAGLLTVTPGKTTRALGFLARHQGENVVAAITDFSLLLSRSQGSSSGTETNTLFSALRDVYDGKLERDIGGKTVAWSGRLTLLAACTPAIDVFSTYTVMLGERFVYFRPPHRDDPARLTISEKVRRRERLPELRESARYVATAIVERGRGCVERIEFDDDIVSTCALLVCDGRASVPRETFGRREICGLVEPELPGRITHQLLLLAESLVALDVKREVVHRIICRTAISSLPGGRAAALRVLAGAEDWIATNAVAQATEIDRKVMTRMLEDLEAVGLVVEKDKRDEPLPGAPRLWKLAERKAADVRRVFPYGQ